MLQPFQLQTHQPIIIRMVTTNSDWWHSLLPPILPLLQTTFHLAISKTRGKNQFTLSALVTRSETPGTQPQTPWTLNHLDGKADIHVKVHFHLDFDSVTGAVPCHLPKIVVNTLLTQPQLLLWMKHRCFCSASNICTWHFPDTSCKYIQVNAFSSTHFSDMVMNGRIVKAVDT